MTEGLKRRIVLPLGGSLAESDHVIGHELVHAFQYDITRRRRQPRGAAAASGIERLPLWFIEGMAEYLSIGPVDPNTAMWMRDAASQEKMPDHQGARQPAVLPVPLGPGALGVPDRPVRRPRRRLAAAVGAVDAGDAEVALRVGAGVDAEGRSSHALAEGAARAGRRRCGSTPGG